MSVFHLVKPMELPIDDSVIRATLTHIRLKGCFLFCGWQGESRIEVSLGKLDEIKVKRGTEFCNKYQIMERLETLEQIMSSCDRDGALIILIALYRDIFNQRYSELISK